eukprot:TRINITY_DN19062_c0_g1_i1.p1 TRINITY_DN19062_c0_g1~~TRINITY_DN19062_c0_g1_i1.p1  ORF type:complete len:232 (-),score=38.21 TRINITY_DN19062_c0_g1_i1:72-767(-)
MKGAVCLLVLLSVVVCCLSQIPASYDLRYAHANCMLPVTNQGQMGSSIIIDGVRALEETTCIQMKQRVVERNLSMEFIAHCCPNQCNPVPSSFVRFMENHGTINKTNCPWKQGAPCSAVEHCKRVRAHVVPVPANPEDIQRAILKYGPIVSLVDAATWELYAGGIIMANTCHKVLDDTVTIIGWGSQNGVAYWIVQNSWGAQWGQNGYAYVQRGVNACGIETESFGLAPLQ